MALGSSSFRSKRAVFCPQVPQFSQFSQDQPTARKLYRHDRVRVRGPFVWAVRGAVWLMSATDTCILDTSEHEGIRGSKNED